MPVLLNQRLALFQYLLQQFGFNKFDDVRREYRDRELAASTPGNSLFFQNLASKVIFPVGELKEYDENLINHLNTINRSRTTPINLKYYQYFSLVFTEYYLNRYFEDKHRLIEWLNAFSERSTQAGIRSLPPYTEADLNKLAYWNATGSGKTFITHINVLQLRHYAKKYGRKFRNLILLTPSEDLSAQHLREMQESNIAANYYWEDKESPSVKVIDVHKIREYASGSGVTVPLAEFERDNAIFVDEGHKGDSKEDSLWRNVRNTVSENGFAFEYSATFGQMRDERLQEEYGKCTIFDYSYGHFWEDEYGKDYWIHNLSDDVEGSREKRYLLQNLLLFLQQKLYYTTHKEDLEPYKIEDPLLIFVGTSVEPKAKGTQAEENEEVISDVKKVLDFFNELFTKRSQYVKWIEDLKEFRRGALFAGDYTPRLSYLFQRLGSASAIYDACLKALFHSAAPDGMELYTIRNAEGEIAIKVKNADYYFGLVYIGDVSSFKTPLEAQFEFRKDVTSPSLFQSLSDAHKNPINVLIGARKFIEGWNNYRVSSIGLINFGRSKGSQIIQLFGRGVRLMGKNNSMKRSRGKPGAPERIEIAETLNIFGLRAEYMKRFKEDLEREGIKTIRREYKFLVKVKENIDQLKLFTLERDNTKPAFETTGVFQLEVEKSITIRLDISPRKFLAIAGRDELAEDVATEDMQFDDTQLNLVDWDDVYLRLMTFKHDRKYDILHISRNGLPALLKGIKYSIISDNPLTISSLQDVEKLQKLVLAVLKRYMESFYNRKLQNYDGSHLKSVMLTGRDPNLTIGEWVFELQTTDEHGNEKAEITDVLKKIETLSKCVSGYPAQLKNNDFLLNAWLDEHLYQPLFRHEQNLQANGQRLLDRLSPNGLNNGEAAFVEDLRNFLAVHREQYNEYDFFLLRNMSRGIGFGFYFMSGGFYPDFLFWIKHKSRGKQYLNFIDPHGLRNEEGGWNSDKLMMHKQIKSIEEKINDPDLVLNTFIIQPPPGFTTAAMDRWHREDDPLQEIDVSAYADRRNVYQMVAEGNRSAYVGRMVKRIVGLA